MINPLSAKSLQVPQEHANLPHTVWQAAEPSRWERCWQHVAILCLPAALWWVNPNWPFQNLGHMDPWYYFGLFHTFPRFHNVASSYAGERMIWIAPGFALVHLFGHVTGVLLLHWTVFLASLYALHYSLRHLTDDRTALVSTTLLAFHPFFIMANGWDYVDSMSIALILISLALLFRASVARHTGSWLLASSSAWTAVVFNYPAWVVLTPGYVYLVAHIAYRKTGTFKATAQLTVVSTISGAVLMTLGVWGTYQSLGGSGFFLANTLPTMVQLSPLKMKAAAESFPYWQASWLVFPAVTFVSASVTLVAARRRPVLATNQSAILLFYLYCASMMILLTVRPPHLLWHYYFASVLLPGVFLTLAITLIRVPPGTPARLFYSTMVAGAVLCLLPAMQPNLYRAALPWGLAAAVALAVLAACCGLLNRLSNARWALSALLLSVSTSALVPPSGPDWADPNKGRNVSERVARAIVAVEDRLPKDRYPVFWIDNFSSVLSPEYRGIMCAFLTHGLSMWEFPKLTESRHYPPGTHIIVITEQRDVTGAAASILEHAGMPVSLVGEDLIAFGGVSYWMTHLQVMP